MTVPARQPQPRIREVAIAARRVVDPDRRRRQLAALALMLDSDVAPAEDGGR